MSALNITLSPTPTVIDDTRKHYDVAIVCIALGVLGTLFVIARLLPCWATRALWWDDWIMIATVVMYIAWTAMAAYVNLHGGIGKPLWEVTIQEFEGIVGSGFLYPAMTVFIRTSIIMFYNRIFGQSILAFRYISWGLLSLNLVYLISYTIFPAFLCKRLHYAWHPLERPLYCNSFTYYYYSVALYSTSIAFDWLLFVLPIWPIFRLVMPMKQKAESFDYVSVWCFRLYYCYVQACSFYPTDE